MGYKKRYLYEIIRPFVSREFRMFFEGITRASKVKGQLSVAERRALYDAVIKRAPTYVYEIGTFTGAGSTYYLASGLFHLREGKVVTLEIDRGLHEKAKQLYKTHCPELNHYVEFLYGDSPVLFASYLAKNNCAEFVFLDGAEDATQSLNQYKWFEPWFKNGSILACHDWNTEKMQLMKKELKSDEWSCLVELGPPISIGMAIFMKL
jgi:predicted O-methyltransferase YrrM